MHIPLRLCGESQTSVVPGEAREDRLNILVGVVAGLNNDLENATLDLSKVHEELEDAHARIAVLEAQLKGRNPLKLKSRPWLCPHPARGSVMENQDLSLGCFRFIRHIVIRSISC
jgi:hypothetical protein